MKKIYLLTTAIFFGSVCAISASNPKHSTNQQSAKNVATSEASSENAVKPLPGIHQPYGSKSNPGNGYRIPFQSIQTSSTGCIYLDDFNGTNTVAGLTARGYKTYYRGIGNIGTTPIWFQGNPIVFSAFNGPATGYVGANYNAVDSGDIDSWMVLPALNLTMGDAIAFYSQAPFGSTRPDSLHVWYSAAGDSVPEDTTWVLLGEFQVNTFGIWENQIFTVPVSSPNGRLAIRYAEVDGGLNGVNSDYIGIDHLVVYRPSASDGTVSAITSPVNGCGLTATEPVTIDITNEGTTVLSGFNVSFTVDGGTPVVESIATPLSPGNTHSYTFTATADLSVSGAHTIDANIIIAADSNSCNDVKTVSITNLASSDPLAVAYKMGFESSQNFTSWRIQDINGDGTTWTTINVDPHSGAICMRKAGTGSDDDDWLITGCLNMVASTNYTLDYWYKNYETFNPCSLETYIGTDQVNTAMTQLLVQHPIPTDTVHYQHGIVTFTVPNSGTYYVGFHAYSFQGTGTSSIRLDDINLDNGNFIGITEPNASNNVRIYPNPGTGIFYLNSHATSKNATVEVFNISGQQVYFSKFGNLDQQSIDLSNQANGVYSVRITSDSFVENQSLVINR